MEVEESHSTPIISDKDETATAEEVVMTESFIDSGTDSATDDVLYFDKTEPFDFADTKKHSPNQLGYKPETLLTTPSILAGFTLSIELMHRRKAIILIRELQKLFYKVYSIKYHCQVPESALPNGVPAVLATGALLVHHFAMKARLQEFPAYELGAACYVIACKVDNQAFNMKDVVEATNLLCRDQLQERIKDEDVKRVETHLIQILDEVELHFNHPDHYVPIIVRRVFPGDEEEDEVHYDKVLKEAQRLLKLCICSPLCLFWCPTLIALGMVGVAISNVGPHESRRQPREAKDDDEFDVDIGLLPEVMDEITKYLKSINES